MKANMQACYVLSISHSRPLAGKQSELLKFERETCSASAFKSHTKPAALHRSFFPSAPSVLLGGSLGLKVSLRAVQIANGDLNLVLSAQQEFPMHK